MTEVTSNFIDVDGIETHYLQCGDASAPPIILIHGGGAGASADGNWGHLLPVFGQNFHTIAMEMVGFGDTAKPDPASYEYSQDNRIKHLARFINAMGLHSVPIIGNSMGGATALGLAMRRPQMVGALVLMGSAGLNTEITPALKPILHYDFSLEGMQKLVDALTGSRFKANDEIIRRRYEDSLRPDTREAYQHIMAWIGKQGGLYYAEEDIARVKTKTLVVNGKEDKVVPLSCAYRFLELLENSHGYIIPHAGHWVMIEAAEEFADIVMHFLRRI